MTSCLFPPRFFTALPFLCAVALATAAPNVITPVPANAVLRAAAVQVRVTPDHRDWTYRTGEKVTFHVAVTADNVPLENVEASCTIGPEMMPAKSRDVVIPFGGLTLDGGTMQEPGFIRCTVSAKFGTRTYRGAATAAFSPEKIMPLQTEPSDFDAFWAAGKAELAKVPIEPVLTLLPDQCTSTVNVYHVSLRTISPSWLQTPGRVFGILCEPKAPGKYPALLRVPGAGVRPYGGDKSFAERGVITLEIGIHGIPVNMPKDVYDMLAAGALNGDWQFNLDDRNSYYYRRVYLSCVRANDFLTSRDNWDGKNLIVAGASQGGQLTIATAALDPRVTGLAATHPAFCDVAAELHGRAGGWPHPFKPDPETGAPSSQATPAKILTASYYDTVNFARRVKVPGFYNWGYNDDVCPPTSTYAAYNVITAPKELGLTLELAHSYTVEQGDAISAWIANRLGLK